MTRAILPAGIAWIAAGSFVFALQTTGQTTTGTQTTNTTGQTTAIPPASAGQEASPAAPGPDRLGGVWKFNKDLSTDTSTMLQQASPPSTNGGSTGGGSGSGYGGGNHHGGGGGGGFGGGRPMPRNNGASAQSTEEAVQTRALIREVAEPPVQLTVVISPTTVEFTDDQGVVRKFTTDGKKESIDLGTAKVDSVSKWDADVLTIELSGGSTKLTETYQVSIQGHILIVQLKTTGGNRANQSGVPVKRIYDKADAGS